MTITLSSKCQVVIPRRFRRRLGLEPGLKLEVSLKDGGVLMRPVQPHKLHRYKIKRDKKTGLPYVADARVPKVTAKEVAAALEEFP